MTQKERNNILPLSLPRSHGVGGVAHSLASRKGDTELDPHLFKEMTDNASQGILVHRDQQPLYVNRAWADLFGVKIDDVMVMPSIKPLMENARYERVRRCAVDREIGPLAPDRHRARIKRPSGESLWIEVFTKEVNWYGAEALQYTVIDVDDWERKAHQLGQLWASMERQVRERTKALDESNGRLHLYEAIINQMSDRISVVGTDYRFRTSNRANLVFRDRRLDELVGVHVKDMIGARLFENQVKHMMDRCFSGEADQIIDYNSSLRDDKLYISEVKCEPFRDPDGSIGGAILMVRDITEAKHTEQQLQLYESTIEQAEDRISIIGTDYRYLMTNKANLDFHRKSFEEVIGRHLAEIVGEQHFRDISEPDLKRCMAGETVKSLRASRDAEGGQLLFETIFQPHRDRDGTISGAIITLRDVTEASNLSERLAYQASHDLLTGLVNRQAFEQHLKQALQETANNSRTAVFCFIDLDQFKIINDTVGHLVGDQLLQQVAKLLLDKIHRGDVLARLGGDEFGLLLRGCSLRRAERAAENLVAALNDFRFLHEGHVFEVGASVGIAVINRYSQDVGEVMSQADLACYAAKDHGRNRVHIYKKRDAFLRRRREEMHQAGGIRAALDQDQFTLYAQPIAKVSATGHEVPDRLEILLRMKGEGNQLIMPASFIPAAERYGFMKEIDRWVVGKTMDYLRATLNQPGAMRVNVNLSGVTLNDDALLNYVGDVLQKVEITAKRVCFEITETAAIRNLAKTEVFIQQLRALGAEFALDDFGSGLSSLNYLKRLPVDYLKIDRTFIRDIRQDDSSRAMVAAIHQMAKALGIKTVAEGVESRTTLGVLNELDIDHAQGFEIGMPAPLLNFY